jgi:hypothetical protein
MGLKDFGTWVRLRESRELIVTIVCFNVVVELVVEKVEFERHLFSPYLIRSCSRHKRCHVHPQEITNFGGVEMCCNLDLNLNLS